MSIDKPKYVSLKKYYGIEVILHIYIKQYRSFEQSNTTDKIRTSTIVYAPKGLTETDKGTPSYVISSLPRHLSVFFSQH